MTQILPIPDIPDELRTAARIGTLVPYIGAGVARLAGCPSWEEFANGSIKFFVINGRLNLSQFEQIKHLHPRIKLSLALSMQDKFKVPIDFKSLLHPDNNPAQDIGRRLYGCLSGFSKVFVTTNYDNWLDEEYPFPININIEAITGVPQSIRRQKIYNPSDFSHDILGIPNTVIHLHGCLDAPDRMILTTKQYAQHYANDRGEADPARENRVLTFLDNLFNTRSVLFIGYGLEELEILEYVIQKGRLENGLRPPKHFILQGFFSHEYELARFLEEYYRGLGIRLIPFSKDYRDYHQLIDVIEHFANSIQIAPTALVQRIHDMRVLLHDQH